MGAGRTFAQKKRLIEEFTNTLTTTLGVPPEMVTIMIDELPKEHIGRAGKPLSEGQ